MVHHFSLLRYTTLTSPDNVSRTHDYLILTTVPDTPLHIDLECLRPVTSYPPTAYRTAAFTLPYHSHDIHGCIGPTILTYAKREPSSDTYFPAHPAPWVAHPVPTSRLASKPPMFAAVVLTARTRYINNHLPCRHLHSSQLTSLPYHPMAKPRRTSAATLVRYLTVRTIPSLALPNIPHHRGKNASLVRWTKHPAAPSRFGTAE